MREPRPVRPEREHPVGQALYEFSRNVWPVYHKRVVQTAYATSEEAAKVAKYEKAILMAELKKLEELTERST